MRCLTAVALLISALARHRRKTYYGAYPYGLKARGTPYGGGPQYGNSGSDQYGYGPGYGHARQAPSER